MAERARFREIGVVEGFYGPVWSEEERNAFLDGVVPCGLNTYLFAPKQEPALGAMLLEPLDRDTAGRVQRLVRRCKAAGINLWVGLHLEPPFDPAQISHLAGLVRKALQLTQAGVRGFAVLLDDLPGARPARPGDPFRGSLAVAQAHAVRIAWQGVGKRVADVEWMVCPGRYSLDPRLEAAHGAFEPDYLARLHAALPPALPWLWTGPQVCSTGVTIEDLEAYLAAAGLTQEDRPIVLWDNYPVNDAALAGRLNLAPLAGRASDLPARVRGYLFNPLRQPRLGLLPAHTCLAYANDPSSYDPPTAWQSALAALLPAELRQAVTDFAALTQMVDSSGSTAVAASSVQGNLPPRLARAWDALTRGEPMEPYLLIDFRRVMTQLQHGLSPALRAEAGPWLGRLWRALRLFETSADGAPQEVLAPLRAEFAEWREAGPVPAVLGTWFP